MTPIAIDAVTTQEQQAAQMLDVGVRKIQYKLNEYGVPSQRSMAVNGK